MIDDMDTVLPFLKGSRKEFWNVLWVTEVQPIKAILSYSYTVKHGGRNSVAECP